MPNTSFEELTKELNESDFFKEDLVYNDDFPAWYYAGDEIPIDIRVSDNLKYLILTVNSEGDISWLLTDKENGDQFLVVHSLKILSREQAVDMLTHDEDVFYQLVELSPILFR